MIKYLLPLIAFLIVGCETDKESKYTYFGGKIINPKSKFIYFGNNDGITDTIALKKDATFLGKFKNLKEGLYYFKHGPELQYVFLEPSDSLLIRLNTWDFDESIVFSGRNANRNNALIETFLQNEKDEKVFNKFYGLDYTTFKTKIDSLKKEKERFNERYKIVNNETSEPFLRILKIATTYPALRKTETFSMHNAKRKKAEKIPNSAYNYRKNINLKLDSLFFFSAYSNIIISQIYSDTYRKGLQTATDDFNNELLQNINKRVHNKKLKNKLLRQTTIGNFYKNSTCSVNPKTFDSFFSLSTNKKDKEAIKLLLEDTQLAKKGDKLTDFTLIHANGLTKTSNELSKGKTTLFYFRNPKNASDDWVASRINYLIRKNPNVEFFVVNILEDNKNYIKNLNIKHQFYLPKNSEAHQFLTSKFSRMIIVNKNGIIENGFGGLSSNKIDKQLETLENK